MKHDYCVACGNKGNLHQHHLVPKANGGTDNEKNLITLCGGCHGRLHGKKLGIHWKKCQREGIDKALANGVKFGAKPKFSNEQIADIKARHSGGVSVAIIAKEFETSRQTIYSMLSK